MWQGKSEEYKNKKKDKKCFVYKPVFYLYSSLSYLFIVFITVTAARTHSKAALWRQMLLGDTSQPTGAEITQAATQTLTRRQGSQYTFGQPRC